MSMEEEKPWGSCRSSLVRIIWIFWYFGIWFEKNRRIFGCFSVQSHFFECISHFTLRFQMFWDGFILPFLWKKWQQINQCCQIFCHGNAADIKRIVYHSSELSGNTVTRSVCCRLLPWAKQARVFGSAIERKTKIKN